MSVSFQRINFEDEQSKCNLPSPFYAIVFFCPKKSYTQKIDSLIALTSPRPFNGVVLITKNGRSKYSKAYGFKNFESKHPLKMDSQFEIMSNTKLFTAVLLLKEVEKGKIDLQSPIKKYLPTLTETWADSVTVHQLLNHTHGISALDEPLLFKAGSQFKYGNLSNILAGRIIENVSHQTYRQLAEELFKSLQMTNTFCFTANDRRNLVGGHYYKNNILTVAKNSIITEENLPADGIITTAKDLAIWNTNIHQGKVLKPETYKLLTTPSVKSQHDVFGKEEMGYGYGIRIAEANGVKSLGHTGLGDGFASINIYFPEAEVNMIVLENLMSEESDIYYFFEKAIKDIVLQSQLIN